MIDIGINVLLKAIVNRLLPSDMEELKYIFRDSFIGKFYFDFSVSWCSIQNNI